LQKGGKTVAREKAETSLYVVYHILRASTNGEENGKETRRNSRKNKKKKKKGRCPSMRGTRESRGGGDRGDSDEEGRKKV